ncbi:MAG: phosphomethylpyrimidine synthase ThiC [Spirochaetes bacterium]|nr:phosphomethylpyrimidine synthase ThiC [Spirochaetota bacterium]
MRQKESAGKGKITEEMKQVARNEGVSEEQIRRGIANGEIVITKNKNHEIQRVCGIGKGLSTKINSNIGSSPVHMNIGEEIEKLIVSEKFGADTVMDLSIGHILDKVRKEVIRESRIPVGTVPIYQVGYEISKKRKNIEDMKIDDILDVIQRQAEEGVDFMTVHCGVTQTSLERMEKEKRLLNIVSRGGSMLVVWMKKNRKENPMFEHYDKILAIAREYDVTLSLGDGFRPGSVCDSSDRGQFQELLLLGELAQRAWEKGVQVMIEGPGHIPLNEIQMNVQMQKSVCHNAPFYVLGPVVTDIAPGYDHITSAIGGTLAAYFGADFLCYVTPSEHLKLPSIEDVKEGVIATKIAAHAADLAKGNQQAWERDRKMGLARKNLDWEKQIKLSLDPEKSRTYRKLSESYDRDFCSMCGEYCAIKQLNQVL